MNTPLKWRFILADKKEGKIIVFDNKALFLKLFKLTTKYLLKEKTKVGDK